MPRDVADIVLPVRIAKHISPQSTGLFEVHCKEPDQMSSEGEGNGSMGLTLGNFAQIEIGVTQPLLVLHPLSLVWSLFVLKGGDRAWVVGSGPLVVVVRRTVPLEIGDRNDRLVDWELLVVHAKTMAVGVWVGKQAGLQDRVSRWLDTRDKVGGRESSLLDLSEVVLGVLIENDLPELAEGEVFVRPDLGEIKDIVTELLGLFWGHGLLTERGAVGKMNSSFCHLTLTT